MQLGAPQWNLVAIRRLIHMSLDGILVTGRDSQGQRKFKGLYAIASLEDSGFTLDKLSSVEGSEIFSKISSDKGPALSFAMSSAGACVPTAKPSKSCLNTLPMV